MLISSLCYFARAAITKFHGLDDLDNRNLSFHSSGGLMYKVKMLTDWVFPKAYLLGLQMAILLCLQMASPLCTHMPGVSCVVKFPFLQRTPVRLDGGSP
jgi:hypothetical protein